MVHKSVLNVDISCEKCKKKVFGIVSKLEGVNKIEADEEKGTIAVIGDVDPYDVITRLRKRGKKACFVSVGPPPKPEVKKTKESCKCKDPVKICSCSCTCICICICPYPYPYPYPYPGNSWGCKHVPVMSMDCQDPNPPCSIM